MMEPNRTHVLDAIARFESTPFSGDAVRPLRGDALPPSDTQTRICFACGVAKPIKTGFYETFNGDGAQACITCTRTRRKGNLSARGKEVTPEDEALIRERLAAGGSADRLAREFHVSYYTVKNIRDEAGIPTKRGWG